MAEPKKGLEALQIVHIPWLAEQGSAYVAALIGLVLILVPMGSAGHLPEVSQVHLSDADFIGSLTSGAFLLAVAGALRVYAAGVVSNATLEQSRIRAELYRQLITASGQDAASVAAKVEDIMKAVVG